MSGNIIRVTKNKDYFAASNEPFNDTRLSWGARGLMGYLLSKPGDWETRNEDLINKGPAGEYKIKRMLRELREYGYMHRSRVHKEDGTFEWVTDIYESPRLNPHFDSENEEDLAEDDSSDEASETEEPSGENQPMVPSGDYPSMDEPSVDNRTIYQDTDLSPNTDQPNTEEKTTATTELDAAVAVASWMGFTGDIGPEMEKHNLTLAQLLAWAFWAKTDGRTSRNPVAVARSRWRQCGCRGRSDKPAQAPDKWTALAQAWLHLDDADRAELMRRAETVRRRDNPRIYLPEEFPYPDVASAFLELDRATEGDVAPQALRPGDVARTDEDARLSTPAQNGHQAAADTETGPEWPEMPSGTAHMWEAVVEQLGAYRNYFRDSALVLEGSRATVVVVNATIADWVNGRLLDSIRRELIAYKRVIDEVEETNFEVTAVDINEWR